MTQLDWEKANRGRAGSRIRQPQQTPLVPRHLSPYELHERANTLRTLLPDTWTHLHAVARLVGTDAATARAALAPLLADGSAEHRRTDEGQHEYRRPDRCPSCGCSRPERPEHHAIDCPAARPENGAR